MPIDQWMYKEILVYPDSGILFWYKKEILTIYDNMYYQTTLG